MNFEARNEESEQENIYHWGVAEKFASQFASDDLIAKKITDLSEGVENEEISEELAAKQLENFVHRRNEALLMLDIGELEKDESKEKAIEYYLAVRHAEVTENFLGNGRVAEVFSIGENTEHKELCVKVVKNPEAYREGLTVHQEAAFMEELKGFVYENTRAPEYFKTYSGGSFYAIVMEELDAAGISRVREGQDEMPDNVDVEKFMTSLRSYITKIHEMGIVHGDLYERNVMIDRKTGHPRVIDFGKSQWIKHMDSGEKKELAIERDFAGMEQIEKTLKTLLLK